MQYFGMDLGTSNSLIAYTEGNGLSPKTPSYPGTCRGGMPMLFWRDKRGMEWAGDQVIERNGLVEDPSGVCQSVKMKIGEQEISLNGHSYSPKAIAAKLIQRLLAVSRESLQMEFVDLNFDTLVVGIPVVFTAAAKKEMQEILETATGGKKIQLIPEPILAALTNDFYTRKVGRCPRRTLVVDVGGGTTDAVLLEPTDNPREPYITKNPKGLLAAGDVMDCIMNELVLDKLHEDSGTLNMSIIENSSHFAARRLRASVRAAKECLSKEESYSLEVSDYSGGSARVMITRAEYENRIRPLVQKIVDLSADVLEGCNLGANPDIDILMVGGTTYTPLLRTMLAEKFPWLSREHIIQRFPEKAVALGAAIYASCPEIIMPKVCYGYAVETHLVENNQEPKKVIEVVIPPNATLPFSSTFDFFTLNAGQESVAFRVYEVTGGIAGQDLEPEQGLPTSYRVAHSFPHPVPENTPIKLTTVLSKDGTLSLTVRDELTNSNPTQKSFSLGNMGVGDVSVAGEPMKYDDGKKIMEKIMGCPKS